MLTVGQLAKRYGISRSTLLYYDKKSLLKPSGRSHGNYREYSKNDIQQLERILLFRHAGLPLAVIAEIIDRDNDAVEAALEKRLTAINKEIQVLRKQQQTVVNLIKNRKAHLDARFVDTATWVEMLRTAGLDDEGMHQWHIQFEEKAPEAHQDFLESLGLEANVIEQVRAWSRQAQ